MTRSAKGSWRSGWRWQGKGCLAISSAYRSHRNKRRDTQDSLRVLVEIAAEGIAVGCRGRHRRMVFRQVVADAVREQLDGDDAEGEAVGQAEGVQSVGDLAVGEKRSARTVALYLARMLPGWQPDQAVQYPAVRLAA